MAQRSSSDTWGGPPLAARSPARSDVTYLPRFLVLATFTPFVAMMRLLAGVTSRQVTTARRFRGSLEVLYPYTIHVSASFRKESVTLMSKPSCMKPPPMAKLPAGQSRDALPVPPPFKARNVPSL